MRRNQLLVGVLAVAGVALSASGQQAWRSQTDRGEGGTVIEFTDRDGANGRIEGDGRVVVIEFKDTDGASYVIDLKDGEVTKALRNGREISADRRTRIEDGEVILLGPGGRELRRFGIPSVVREGVQVGRFFERPAGVNEFAVDLRAAPDTPPVMLGVLLSDAGGALRWHLGIGEDEPAILIDRVVDGLPADKAGLRKYDVVIGTDAGEIDGATLTPILRELEPGDELDLEIIREGRGRTVTVTLEAFDAVALGVELPAAVGLANVERADRFPALVGNVFTGQGDGGSVILRERLALAEQTARARAKAALAAQNGRLEASVMRLQATEKALKAAREQFEQGLVPSTRVAQAEIAVAEARAAMVQAEAELAAVQLEAESAERFGGLDTSLGWVFENGKLTRIPGSDQPATRTMELEAKLAAMEARLEEMQEGMSDRLERLMERIEEKLDDLGGE